MFHATGFLSDAINTFLLVYAGLFPIVNPVGSAPIFLGMTAGVSPQARYVLARKVAINGFFLLFGSLLVGSHVLEFFGITVPVVRIGGGLVVTSFGWKMLHAGEQLDKEHDAQAADEASPTDAFYPLTLPLTVGPGSISVAITLGSQRPKADDLYQLAALGSAATLALLALSATIFLCYRFAERMVARLGDAGTNVVVRLSAFILLCIGIQILWSGISALLMNAPS